MPLSASAAAHPVAMTAEIVSAFVSHNALPPAELVALIQSVHAGLVNIASGAVTPAEPPAPTPAVTSPSVDQAGLSRLLGRRQDIQISAAAPGEAGHDARAISRQVALAG